MAAGFYTVAYIGFGFPLLIASLAAAVGVTVLFGLLALVCALLALQQGRARL